MTELFRGLVWILALLIGCGFAAGSASAAESAMDSRWRFAADLYLWGASVGATAATGSEVEIEFDDIIDQLEFAFMGVVGVRKGKWTLAADMIYMDASDSGQIGSGIEARADLTTWVITPLVGYNLIHEGNSRLDLLAGARFLSIEPELKVDALGVERDESKSNWDGLIGVRGAMDLAGDFFLFGLADVGTGDSDLTWQALGGVGYRFSRINLVVGYRYLSWEFGDDIKLLDDLELHGPVFGIQFIF